MPAVTRNKIALVTGASKGLGRAIAIGLAERGMDVAIAARSEAGLQATAEAIAGLGRESFIHAADLREPSSAADFVAAALQRFGRIDLLVNNAGATQRGDFLSLTDHDWHDGYELKLHGAVRMCRAAWPHLMASRGSIVNIAGVGGRAGSAEFTIGGSVNAALMLFTKCLADRGIADGVRVNAINPGSIRTDRLSARIGQLARDEGVDAATAADRMAAQQRIARFGEPNEIADAVAFLAGDQAQYIQGAILDVDGGMTRGL